MGITIFIVHAYLHLGALVPLLFTVVETKLFKHNTSNMQKKIWLF